MKKQLRLKRKWLVIFTILLTILSMQSIKLIQYRIDWIKKEIEKCDTDNAYTCSTYELNQHFIRNTDYN